MKLIFKIILGIVLGVFVVFGLFTCLGGLLDDDDNTQTEETEEYEERIDDSYDEDDTEENNIAPGEESDYSVSNWGDGTCRAIDTKQFYQLVASKKQNDTYIGEGPCVVDFWADWCGYCKQIDPYLKSLAKKYKGKVQFYKVNADENPELMQLYGIDGLPTLFFCNGDDIQINSGAYSQAEFDEMIQAML